MHTVPAYMHVGTCLLPGYKSVMSAIIHLASAAAAAAAAGKKEGKLLPAHACVNA